MTDGLNSAFVCACGGTRFIELVQWNSLVCRLAHDPEENPTTILCWACRRVYAQAPDWSWRLAAAPLHPGWSRD